MRLVLAARSRGVRTPAVLEAIEAIPRRLFVEPIFADRAFEDAPLPIPCGQSISQPSIVAVMTEALGVGPRDKVLEVGAGSGYHAAIVAQLCRRLYAVERHPTLARAAQARFDALGLSNISLRLGDGGLGWPEQAPFDRIIATAAADDPPSPLLAQLRDGGVMVLPVDQSNPVQTLVRIEKNAGRLTYHELGPVRFVPLLEGVASDDDVG